MLTPQEVSNHAFAKAVMGGYNMAMVDEFLDELTDDYTSLYKENAALKAKMKVLVDKVEEYRSTEDAMRAALLTAQKMADSMVAEAEEKKKSLLENAESEANRKIGALRDEVAHGLGKFGLFGASQPVGDVAHDYAGTLHGRKGVVGIHAILILGEEGRIVYFADIMIERTCPDKLHVSTDAVGGLGGQIAHGHGVLEGAGTFARKLADGAVVEIGTASQPRR